MAPLESSGVSAGLFPPYDAEPDVVDGHADRFETVSANALGLGEDVRGAGTCAAVQVSPELAGPVQLPTKLGRRNSADLAGAAMVASGAMTLWSGDIRTYNSGVGTLNARWRAARASDFGVAAADYSDADCPAERTAVADGRADAVAGARSALLQELRDAEAKLAEALDKQAGVVSGKLNKGPTEENVLALLVAGALPASAFAVFPGIKLNADQLAAMRAALQRNGTLGSYFTPRCGMSASDLKAMLDHARAMGLDPKQYKDLLQQYYVTKAAETAGIDMCDWDPSKGAEGLRDIIEKVYTYYGRLYLDNPNLKWAGMANMIGPSFAAGFFDLNMIRDAVDTMSGPLDDLPDEVRGALPYPLNELGTLSELTQEDIAFYEETFLQMQKDIFIDQAAMHEAYLEGGMDAIEEMDAAGLFDNEAYPDQTVNSWEQLDEGIRTGDNDLVNAGNEGLLYREQHDIIDDAYQQMYDHDPTGPAMTYLMGVVGDPSIPGAQSLGEVDPLEFEVPIDTPGPFPGQIGEIAVETPLPDGNIADFETRWGLIEDDTLPSYLEIVDGDPAQARDIIGSDVHDRIEENRLVERLPEITERLGTDWEVRWDWF